MTSGDRCQYADEHPAIQRDLDELRRRIGDVEGALRSKDGIYDKLEDLRLKLTALTVSLRTAVVLGTALGTAIGTVATIVVNLLGKR